MTATTPLRALALVCTLKPGSADSSTDLIAHQVLAELDGHGVVGSVVRVVDHDVKPGVEVDMGDGDQWPAIRAQLLDADILVLATPTWVGQHSSVAQRVFERLDAEISETGEDGNPHTFGKVAVIAVVGNEDGAHHISGIAAQVLGDTGFTVPAQGVTYWNGEAMHPTDFKDLDETPEGTASTTKVAAANAAHLARLLRDAKYPPSS
ncbi:Multimeric flavodoxin WrbA [Jatrophihabitans endophyticus]|uniref:Multimeric flavodoxin WrbA n=1 Tax=Jatrophihabitans endophyticus TaxID=1206085 RepID=A0A1M5Q889_9ACTN|nr:NAD(P)H-dependent oxidoreductase [Jatrophihabitans endophyticus]SHH10222.1 Multimeric flavodoxin WrbA [Jatrophihabitans endophyticus]